MKEVEIGRCMAVWQNIRKDYQGCASYSCWSGVPSFVGLNRTTPDFQRVFCGIGVSLFDEAVCGAGEGKRVQAKTGDG